MQSIHRTTVDLILNSVTNHPGEDGLMSSFLFDRSPSSPFWQRKLGVTIFFSQRSMVKAALFVKRHGPSYIDPLPIDDIRTMLQDFLKEHFSYVARETLFHTFSEHYGKVVSNKTKEQLALALANSAIFSPTNTLTVFPLVTINVEQDFSSSHYFLRSPEGFINEISPEYRSQLTPNAFPPILNAGMRTEAPAAWLGVRSPILQNSMKMKTAIMGAIALSLPLSARYMFSGRKVFGGHCTFSAGASIVFGDSHTPPVHRNIIIRRCDKSWLDILSTKIQSSDRNDRRHIRALEYFCRAWIHGRTERFPFLCMALDALYSEAGRAILSVIEGISDTLGPKIEAKRLRTLMDLRASVIHGGAPNVSDSSKYRKYYELYLTDPIDDLDDVFAEAARRRVFGSAFEMQTEDSASAIAKLQESGRLPRQVGRHGILNDA